MIFFSFWAFGTLAFLIAFWIDGEIRISEAAIAIICGWGWPLFLALYLFGRYGDCVIWRRK